MIVPEKVILLTNGITDDIKATALEKYINGNVFGYHVITISEEQFASKTKKLKRKIIVSGIRHGVNLLNFDDKVKKVKVKYGASKTIKRKTSVGRYRRINNIVSRFNAKALFCTSTYALYSCIKARKKFGFNAKIVAYFDSFTFDKNSSLLEADKYLVENVTFKEELIKFGVKPTDIEVMSFPINKDAFIEDTAEECKAMFDLTENKTVLINGGIIGDYKVVELFNLFSEIKDKFNVVVYLGENEKLYQKLNKIKDSKKLDNFKLFTTINNIEKLFNASDVVITVYDLYAMYLAKIYNKKLIVFAPKNDAQQNDFEYLQKNGKLLFAKDSSDIVVKTFDLLNSDNVAVNDTDYKSSSAKVTNYIIQLLNEKN